jgi:hypothetical protein
VQNLKEFFLGLINAIIQGLPGEARKQVSDAIGDGIAQGVEKSRKKLLAVGVSIALIGIGLFLILWGIATSIDMVFGMRGFGYVLIGIPAILIGIILYKS